MIKKFLLVSVIASQLLVSCDKTEEPVVESEKSLTEQIATIMATPYSSLPPDLQKVKLEAEANDMLVQMDKSKTSGAIEAIQNLGDLLSISSVDIFNGKNDDDIAEILNVSGVYGIYTWSNTQKIWIKTESKTDLKFVFPAKKSQTVNNAILSSKSTSSDIKVGLDLDQIFLPNTVDATLTIDNAPAATFTTNAKYSNGKDTPDESGFKMVLNDGYTWETSGKKAQPNTSKAAFTFNGKNLVEFNAGSTANIDGLLKDDALVSYQGKANGLIRIMDNFVIVADNNTEGLTNDLDVLDNSLIKLDYNKKTYYTDQNSNNEKESKGKVEANNKNTKLILVSKKDGTKIADVIQRSEKGSSYTTYRVWVTSSNAYGGYWNWSNNLNSAITVQHYEENLYLRFNDKTEVEMSAYFSTGFDALETKFESFLNSFERK